MTDSPERTGSPVVDDVKDGTAPGNPDPVTVPAPRRRRRARGVILASSGPTGRAQLSSTIKAVRPPIERIQQAVAAPTVHHVRVADLAPSVSVATAAAKLAVGDGGTFSAVAAMTRNLDRAFVPQQIHTFEQIQKLNLLGQSSPMRAVGDSVAGATAATLASLTKAVLPSVASMATEWASPSGAWEQFADAQVARMVAPVVVGTFQSLHALHGFRAESVWASGLTQFAHAASVATQFGSNVTGLVDMVAGLSVIQEQLHDFLSSHITLLARGMETARHAVRAVKRRIFLDALAAQDAAMHDDLAEVDAFFRRWAELPRSHRTARIRAAATVLLDLDLTELGPDDAFDLIERIEKDAKHYYLYGSRPLSDGTINHQPVILLGGLQAIAGADNAEAALPCAPSAESRAIVAMSIIEDPRLAAVMQTLKPDELQMVHARGLTRSWLEAAVACGVSPAEARRVSERISAKILSRTRRLQRSGWVLNDRNGR